MSQSSVWRVVVTAHIWLSRGDWLRRKDSVAAEISAAGSLPTGALSLFRMHSEAVSFERCECFGQFRCIVVTTVRCGLRKSPGSVVPTVRAGT